MNFTAIDFETANSKRSSACSVGMAIVKDGEITETIYQLIRPFPLQFDGMNISIHGIREHDVANAPTFEQLWPVMAQKIHGPIVAHNASFDMSVLRASLDDMETSYPVLDYFCTYVLFKQIMPELGNHKLNTLSERYGIELNHHNAVEDAVACAQLAILAAGKLECTSLHDLGKAANMRMGKLKSSTYTPCGKK